MSQTVLILGARGRFGRNAAEAFEATGWTVRRFDRKRDDLDTAARGVDVIVNAWNPRYSKWREEVMPLQTAIHRVALANNALVVIPGNLYVFGEAAPAPWSAQRAHLAENELGRIRIEMEASYRKAGVRTLVLRAGDYLDTEASGNWFDKIMAPSLKRGRLTYPGQVDTVHEWAFLPDVARATVLLCEKRAELDHFTEISFPGYAITGQEMAEALAQARGHEVGLKPMAWWLLHLARPFIPDVKHFFEMRYLWNLPHWLEEDGLKEHLPEFEGTPLVQALEQASRFVPKP